MIENYCYNRKYTIRNFFAQKMIHIGTYYIHFYMKIGDF